MSAVEDFLARAAKDPALRKEVLRAQIEAAARVAEAHGFHFTAEEYLKALATLNDAEMEAVVGGTDTRYTNQDTDCLLKRAESYPLLVPIFKNG